MIAGPVYVAGHRGLVGSAIVRALTHAGHSDLLLRTRTELDLTNQHAVQEFFATHRPASVILAAAKVGGILANATYPADFIRDNLAIELNVISAAHEFGVKKLLMLGSSCIYPRLAPQPIREEYLLTGPLEPTNAPYAVAKIAGISLCQAYAQQYGDNYISVMPTNLYGPHDNFDLETSHVLPALIRKIHEAKMEGRREVTLWGTGAARREFLYVDDLADACVFLMNTYNAPDLINVGVGEDISIRDLAHVIAQIVGYTGEFVFDTSKPDGTPRKLLDTTKINTLGWTPRTTLDDGIRATYDWFLQHIAG